MTNTNRAQHIIHHQPQVEPKPRALLALLEHHAPNNALILCYETAECDLLARFLARYGFITKIVTEYNAQELTQYIEDLANGKPFFVICQNSLIDDKVSLASVAFLVNYDIPERPQLYEKITQFNADSHIHRIIANLVADKESSLASSIKNQYGIDFVNVELPSSEEALKLSAKRMLKSLLREAKEMEISQYESLAQEMIKEDEAALVLSMLLKNHLLQKISLPEPVLRERSDTRSPRGFSSNKLPMRRSASPIRKERVPKSIEDEPTEPEPVAEKAFEAPKNRSPYHGHDEARHEERIEMEEPSFPEDGVAKLYVTLGRKDGIKDLASLAQFLSKQARVDLGHFCGGGMVRDQSSHIEVDEEVAEKIIQSINGMPRIGEDDEGAEARVICQRAQSQTPQKPLGRRPMRKRFPHSQHRHR